MDIETARKFARDTLLYLKLINPHLPEKERWRTGGWLHISDPTGNVIVHQQVGEITMRERSKRYERLSAEKSARLRANPDHRGSWESRDPNLDQWGGAVRTLDGWIFSFSGSLEIWDVALVVALLAMYEEEVSIHVREIAGSDEAASLVALILTLDDGRDL